MESQSHIISKEIVCSEIYRKESDISDIRVLCSSLLFAAVSSEEKEEETSSAKMSERLQHAVFHETYALCSSRAPASEQSMESSEKKSNMTLNCSYAYRALPA